MSRCDFSAARDYVFGRLERELSPKLHYHCIGHTRDDVLPAAMRLAGLQGISEEDRTLLATGVLFHDLGFVERSIGHEEVGVRIAREVLPGFGFAPAEIDTAVEIIMATKLPQSPRTLLQQLMADADLDVLGREDFFVRGEALRAERAASGPPIGQAEWYAEQRAFLAGHSYFTAVAKALRDAGKRANLAELERRIEDLEGSRK